MLPLFPLSSKDNRYWCVATSALVGLNIAIFVAMVHSGASPIIADPRLLLTWGANYGPFTLQGQYWRVVTSSFVHLEVGHLTINMLYLWWLGRTVEKIFGALVFIGICFLTAIGASLVSLLYDPSRVSAGASGMIFGLAGLLIMLFFHVKSKSWKSKLILGRLITLTVCGLIYGLLPGTDNVAHLGGLMTGLALGFVFARLLRRPRGAALAFATLHQARLAIEANDFDSAVLHLKSYVTARPRDPDGHRLLGYSLDVLSQYDEASLEYRHALDLAPQDEITETNLAVVFLCQGRHGDAVALIENGYAAFSPLATSGELNH